MALLFSLSENAYGVECVSVCVCYTLVRFQFGQSSWQHQQHTLLFVKHHFPHIYGFLTLFNFVLRAFFAPFSISFGSSLCSKHSLHFWWVNVYTCVCSRQWANVSHLMWLGVNASIVLLFAIRDGNEGCTIGVNSSIRAESVECFSDDWNATDRDISRTLHTANVCVLSHSITQSHSCH